MQLTQRIQEGARTNTTCRGKGHPVWSHDLIQLTVIVRSYLVKPCSSAWSSGVIALEAGASFSIYSTLLNLYPTTCP